MSKKALKIILLWLLAEALVWIPFHNLISYNNLLVATLYFLFFSFLTLVLFKDIFKNLVINTKTKNYLLLIASLLLHGAIYWICNNYLNEPTELIKNSPASYTLVNNYFLWVKPIDILLQQLMLIVLVTKLHENKVSLKSIIIAVAIIFGAIHIDSLQRMEIIPALILTVSATAMSLVIPYMILRVKNGYLYNLMIHLAFVDIAALLFWSLY